MRSYQWTLPALGLLQSTVNAATIKDHSGTSLTVPQNAQGASIPHSTSFVSFSMEPAFWVEFWGDADKPNKFMFDIFKEIIAHGAQPHIRPGGETMDSMIFSPTAGNPVRTTSPNGGIYRTTVGPAYYKSWSNFPNGTKFTSTLNFGNDSLPIALNMAVASVKYQPDLVEFLELGNEPNEYGSAYSRWDDQTIEYVRQWQNWTLQIDAAVNKTLGQKAATSLGGARWWASSSTTDSTGIALEPVNLIPDGIDSHDQVGQYSIHSYQFDTCNPYDASLATVQHVLNHTLLVSYADEEIVPSALAALNSGRPWIIGEFNSIACSGSANVSDTFAQALWTVDSELIYAVRNASATYLHQGATLVFQSSDQSNSAGPNGSPDFSTYDMVYPRNSPGRGPKRTLPGFLGVLFSAEAFAIPNTQVLPLAAPSGINADYFSAYALYVGGKLNKLAILNMNPYYANSTNDYSFTLNIASAYGSGQKQAWLKRMTSTSVDEQNSTAVTWAGQSYANGPPTGKFDVETVGSKGAVTLRGSEAVLVFFDKGDVYGLS